MSELNIITATTTDDTEQLEFDGMPETATLTVEEIVESLVDKDEYNAYGVHKVVNATLEVLGAERRIIPQMMYNYSRNGLIAKRDEKPNRNHVYTAEQVKAFVAKWINKNNK